MHPHRSVTRAVAFSLPAGYANVAGADPQKHSDMVQDFARQRVARTRTGGDFQREMQQNGASWMAGMNLSRGKTMATVNVLLQARNVRPVRRRIQWRCGVGTQVDIVECVKCGHQMREADKDVRSMFAKKKASDRDFSSGLAICRRFWLKRPQTPLQSAPLFFPCL